MKHWQCTCDRCERGRVVSWWIQSASLLVIAGALAYGLVYMVGK